MKFNDYQEESQKTVAFRDKKIPGIVYCALKLAGEAGEVAEKIGKIYRDDDGKFTHEKELAIAYELGDVLWYVAAITSEIGYQLDDIAQMNIDKLQDRLKRGVIQGSGDNR